LTRAADLDRPLFISIGYATCHWCHVMERESFEHEDVGDLLNASFVPIKVDREEHPDVDHFYMSACTAGGRRGGWPLTIIALPDGRPFYAATYLPKNSVPGRLGLTDLLSRIAHLWDSDRTPAIEAADDIVKALDIGAPAESIRESDFSEKAVQTLGATFDATWGGFGGAPRFPTFHQLRFLLRAGIRSGQEGPIAMVERSLEMIRSGGVWDHVGHGFHRYATDARWHLPHFEKMLYDQAMALCTYAEAWAATGRDLFRETCEHLFDVLERDFRSENGVYFAAWDADSEGEEGKYYVWSHNELSGLVEPVDLQMLVDRFGVREDGNFEDEATGRRIPANILDALAVESGPEPIDPDTIRRFESVRTVLLEARAERIPPLRDEKVLLDWNAMTAGALAVAGRLLGNEPMILAATRCAERLYQVFEQPDGTFLRRRFERDVGIEAQLDDHAWLAWACLELFQTTGGSEWMDRCMDRVEAVLEHYWSPQRKAFFVSSGKDIPLRLTRAHDEAVPSGAAIVLCVLSSLASLTGESRYEEVRRSALEGLGAMAERWPTGFTGTWCAAPSATRGEIVMVGGAGDLDRDVLGRFLPDHSIIRLHSSTRKALGQRLPHLLGIPLDDPAVYVCTGQTCGLPARTSAELDERLAGPSGSGGG